jgi:hypothetical protein
MFADIVELSADCNVSKNTGITPPIIQELKWDDGVHCGYYYGPNMYRATTFTAPYDLLIVSMKIFWYNCTSVNTVELDIYSDDGGYPDEGLFSEPVEDNIPVGG